jgi:hypothetical protein
VGLEKKKAVPHLGAAFLLHLGLDFKTSDRSIKKIKISKN